jgi:hypothetical protein
MNDKTHQNQSLPLVASMLNETARELYDIETCGFFQRVAYSRSIYWVQTFASEKPRERAPFWVFSTCTRQSVISAGSITQIQSADIIKKKAYKTIF